MDESIKDRDGKDIVQSSDHGLSGRECSYQTPGLGAHREEMDSDDKK